MDQNKKYNLLIGCTACGPAMRIPEIIESFKKTNKFTIRVIFTKFAKIFVDNAIKDYEKFQKENDVEFFYGNDEFEEYVKNRSRVLHIELRKWADVVVLLPLSANSLAKITNGICDNLLTCVLRAWDFNKKGYFCLAMEYLMYQHFITKKQVDILTKEFKFIEIPSEANEPKPGEISILKLASNDVIVDTVLKGLSGK